MGFPRQEHWSALPLPPPGDLPNQGTEPMSSASPALAGRFFTTEPPGKPNTEEVVDNYGKICKDSSWREMDLIFKNFPTNKSPGPDGFIGEFIKNLETS